MDIFEENAAKLVERIKIALIAERRDVAEKLALDALRGHVPVNDEQFAETLAEPSVRDVTDTIWRLAERVFAGKPAAWRSQVGRLIKICGRARALTVVSDCDENGTQDPKSYLAGAIAKGKKNPCWRMSDAELVTECESYGVSTAGKDRRTLEKQLESSRRRTDATDCGGLGKDFIDGHPNG